MPEFQPRREGSADVGAPPLASQPDARLEPGPAAPQSSGPPRAALPPKPLWAALLDPGGATETGPPDLAQLAASAPALGKTQAGNILASLANDSAVLATAPSTPPSTQPGAAPLVGRSGPVAKASPSPTSSLLAPVASSRAAAGAIPGSAAAVGPLKSAPGPGLGGPGLGGPGLGGPGLGGPASGRRATTASAPATANIATANIATANISNESASRSPSETNENAAANPHDDDILPSKPRASFRMRLPSRPVRAPKEATNPRDATPSPIAAKPSLRERASGVSQLLSGPLRAYSRGRGSS